MEHDHHPHNIAKRFSAPPKQSYVRDWVYGGIDGAVTTFALVAGAIGAHTSHMIVLLLGTTNIIADGFSMAAANFLATKSEDDEYDYYENIEKKHIKKIPAGERHEIRQIFSNKGFKGKTLEKIVKHLTSNRKLWIHTMLREEYGLPHATRSPWLAAISTYLAFLLCGFIPLFPFLFKLPHAFQVSSIFTGVVFFCIGVIKGRWSTKKWWFSGALSFLIGTIAALLGYGIGELFTFFRI